MAAIALIGPDGAGKTTLTRMLEHSKIAPFKYLYMGIRIPASNVALPTSRLAERLKARSSQRTPRARPRVLQIAWAAARLGNRLVEEWYRQLLSWYYQRRGFTVLYDRHYVFDFSPHVTGEGPQTFDKRIHRWLLRHLYPRPDLVIFLDAPGDLLFARKGELTVEELERRRQAFLQTGAGMPGFVRVDATRPIEQVFADVAEHVLRACGRRPTLRPIEGAP